MRSVVLDARQSSAKTYWRQDFERGFIMRQVGPMALSPTCLGPYEIPASLGAGGMGEVYRRCFL
jgi:hypothetical protein